MRGNGPSRDRRTGEADRTHAVDEAQEIGKRLWGDLR